MTKSILLTAFAFFLTCSTASSDSYLIQTKDGEEFETSQYWQDGGEIKFEVDQGIMGISVGDVKQIKRIAGQRKSRVIEKAPEEATAEATSPKQEQNLPDGSNHATTDDPIYRQFEGGVRAFEKRVLQEINLLTKKELVALADEGVTLEKQMFKTNQIQQLAPLLLKLDKAIDLLEDRIRQSP